MFPGKPLIIFIFLVFLAFPQNYIKASEPIKILLVPGHDNEIWGAQYGNVKEAAMNLAVASRIHAILKKDKRFKVFITRNTKGYTQEFEDYFTKKEEEIIAFRETAKKETQDKIANGDFTEKENVPHNNAADSASVILYGINKWANENKMDAVIHVHFNDYPRTDKWTIGKYQGFAIYMPDGQMANSDGSSQLAANIFIQLDKKYNASSYEKEYGGLIPDQKLIAIGANGTLESSVRSVLVEYGYIYEKIFRKHNPRHQAYSRMASLTAQGIKNYFFSK